MQRWLDLLIEQPFPVNTTAKRVLLDLLNASTVSKALGRFTVQQGRYKRLGLRGYKRRKTQLLL